jgi:hypothetical protein
MGGLREGLGGLGYRSVTYLEHTPGRTGLGRAAVLQRPCRAGPMLRLSCDPVRQIAKDHAIGDIVAGVDLPALVL